MKKDRKWLWPILIVLAVLLAGWMGVRWWNRDIVPVKTTEVKTGAIEQVVSASGIVDAPVYELGTKMGGKIAFWNVKEGARVSKGQLLAQFDNYEQARNDFKRAQRLFEEGAASSQAYDAAKTVYDSSRIISPNVGVVAKINFDEGETVVPGQPAVIVVNYDKSWIEAQIDEIDIADIKIGDRVAISSDVYPDKVYLGEIYWIAPLAELRKVGGRVKMDEESYVFPCKIRFLGEHRELKVNMSVNIEIVTKRKSGVVVVPREALVSHNDKQAVYVVKKWFVRETPIEVGIRSYTSVEAVSGVKEGDIVAISNLAKLKDKGRVSIEK